MPDAATIKARIEAGIPGATAEVDDWTGGGASTRFDAGLTNAHQQPREGYVVVCRALHAAKCAATIARATR